MEEVGAGVVQREPEAARRLHGDRDLLALAEPPARDRDAVDEEPGPALERVEHARLPLPTNDRARVALLAARLRVARRAVQDDLGRLAGDGLRLAPVGDDDRQDPRRRGERVVAEELGLRQAPPELEGRLARTRLAPEGGAGARARALPLHLGLELAQRVVGHDEPEVRERLLREVGREAVRVVEREQELAVDDVGALGRVGLGVLADLRDPDVERLGEALLLGADRALHARHLGA